MSQRWPCVHTMLCVRAGPSSALSALIYLLRSPSRLLRQQGYRFLRSHYHLRPPGVVRVHLTSSGLQKRACTTCVALYCVTTWPSRGTLEKTSWKRPLLQLSIVLHLIMSSSQVLKDFNLPFSTGMLSFVSASIPAWTIAACLRDITLWTIMHQACGARV